jgi:pimeloyl-ACP methyl ester carboxylesterase
MAHVLRRAALLALVALSACATPHGLAFRRLSYPVPVSYLRFDGLDIAYCDVGAGPRTLVLIHGLGSYLPVWSRNLDALSKHYRVVALDLPGYGKSSKANYRYSMAFFARVVDRMIALLKLPHPILVGHSMGGQIAMTHALMFPGRAEALVLVDPAGFETFGPGEGSWLAEAVTKKFVEATPPDAVYANVAVNFHHLPKAARFMVRDRLRVIGGPDFDAYAYAVSRSVYAMVHEPVASRVGEIAVPTLVIFGADDRLIPNPILHGGTTQAIAAAGVAKLPHARLVVIPRAGHMVQFERPEAFDAAVLDFLKEVAP